MARKKKVAFIEFDDGEWCVYAVNGRRIGTADDYDEAARIAESKGYQIED